MRFWKRKKESRDYFLRNIEKDLGIPDIKEDIQRLKAFVDEFECKHDFICIHSGRKQSQQCILFECSKCGKRTIRTWKQLAQKEQLALKSLRMVPEEWRATQND